MKKALIIVNLGSPDKPELKEVKAFLSEFLNDKEVIDLPFILRKFLVNCIIIPFRTKHSTALYKQLWTAEGSPLIAHTEKLRKKLDEKLEDTDVFAAMRYGKPSLISCLNIIKNKEYDEIVVLPLFPQYATSTTKSTIDFIEKEVASWKIYPNIRFIKQFYDNPSFIKAVCSKIREHDLKAYDHILFSYHALPLRHLDKLHNKDSAASCSCTNKMPAHGEFCYKATCYQTTRLIAKELELDEHFFSSSFQSRMSKNWTKPFTTDTLVALAKTNKKNVLIVSPAFVADCLETSIELAIEGRDLFVANGGSNLQLVENLNDSDYWLEAICDII